MIIKTALTSFKLVSARSPFVELRGGAVFPDSSRHAKLAHYQALNSILAFSSVGDCWHHCANSSTNMFTATRTLKCK